MESGDQSHPYYQNQPPQQYPQQQYYQPPQPYQPNPYEQQPVIPQYGAPQPVQQYGNDIKKNDIEQQAKDGGLLGSQTLGLGFIRKVYLILASQLIFTVMFTCISMYSIKFAYFQWRQYWIMIVLLIAAIVVEIAIFCCRNVARKVPTNYICLFIFTFAFAWMISFICAAVSEEKGKTTVLMAALLTMAITIGLTIYAFTTKTDFTWMGGIIWVFIMTFLMFGFMCIFWSYYVMNMMYCAFGIILYGFYLIYDTQLIAGGGRFQLDCDDYIIGALILYIDIIGMFLRLLALLSSR